LSLLLEINACVHFQNTNYAPAAIRTFFSPHPLAFKRLKLTLIVSHRYRAKPYFSVMEILQSLVQDRMKQFPRLDGLRNRPMNSGEVKIFKILGKGSPVVIL
jgi:hypothetical protein